MTETRPEIIVEGSEDGVIWRTYGFKYKVGKLGDVPFFVSLKEWVRTGCHKKIPPIAAPIRTRIQGAVFQICKPANRMRASAKLFAESIALVQIGR
jgi:hypothetical protein